ncbi:MAG: hypothetical protein U0354_16005 [Candidatus Sericytochromatia bacterium]
MLSLKNNNLTSQSGIIKYNSKRTFSGTNLEPIIKVNITKNIQGSVYTKTVIAESNNKILNTNNINIIDDKDKMKIISKYNSLVNNLEDIELQKNLKTNDLIRRSIDSISTFIVNNLRNYKFTIEITSDNSIFFTIVMDKDIEIHYDFFIEEVGKEKEVLFSLYQNKNCLIYGWDNIENSFERLNKVLESVK